MIFLMRELETDACLRYWMCNGSDFELNGSVILYRPMRFPLVLAIPCLKATESDGIAMSDVLCHRYDVHNQ
ncbi:hypothetical protein M404DRAFT_727725 [Pisolithus tinctorius Marx 270]|uniref:Uncharacterized protein n=1 Tax=Pisolithus tinctorius Marx 270 TaxID=870435 RepID=A0A0C3NKV1_PISTI|nr:hypothetical protein M404DRAFT_727725 [Pisolithus tinctorius Marx 270]